MGFFHPNFMLQIPHHQDHDLNHPSTSLPPLLPSCTIPQEFHGVGSLLGKRSSMAFSTGIMDGCSDHQETMNINHNHGGGGGDEDLSDDEGSQLGEKKRRLNMEQVKTLEKNFEVANKLEPERKMQLARALGLQPRQIAIWFQNRRARWKTKQLEKDYEVLKRQFDGVKAENDALLSQNQKLHAEIMALKTSSTREHTESINLNKETEGSSSNRSEHSSEIKLDIISRSTPPPIDSPLLLLSSNNNNTSIAGRSLFQSSLTVRPQNNSSNSIGGVAQQLFHNKMDQSTVKEESLCNLFCGVDDQTGFWPWLEQQPFN